MTIKKVVENKATYYSKISALPGWTKPNQTEDISGISFWIDEEQALRKYEFQCDKSAKYVPISGYKMTAVRLVNIQYLKIPGQGSNMSIQDICFLKVYGVALVREEINPHD